MTTTSPNTSAEAVEAALREAFRAIEDQPVPPALAELVEALAADGAAQEDRAA